ncbi:hypothetical protein V8C40DRAFT_245181 [Trichoderma camerunense]
MQLNRVCICICTSSRHGYCPIPRPTANPRALLTATCTLFDCPYLSIVKGASPGTQGMCAFSPPIARLASRPWPVLTQTWHASLVASSHSSERVQSVPAKSSTVRGWR